MTIPTADLIAAEEPLVGMIPKTVSEMTEEELRTHVRNIRTLRTSAQSLRAEMAIKKSIANEAKEATKVASIFEEF